MFGYEYLLVLIFIIINIVSFVLMFVDKVRAVKHSSDRISEGVMFFWGAIFGSLGIYLGMYIFRHKTKKWYFKVVLPLLFFQNLVVLYFLYFLIKYGENSWGCTINLSVL